MESNNGHDPIAIANYFIKKSDYDLTLMQVLKLSYMAHGFKLGLKGKPLSCELAAAWKHGPVFPSIYHEFKTQPPSEAIKKLGREWLSDLASITNKFSKDDKGIMDFVHDVYGKLDAWKLSALTHKEGTPWHNVYHKADATKSSGDLSIPNSEIEKHFKEEIIAKIKKREG